MANHEDALFEQCTYCGHFGFSCTKKQSKDCENMKDPNPQKEEWDKLINEARDNLLNEAGELKNTNRAERKPIFSGRGVKVGPFIGSLIVIYILYRILDFST